MPVTVNEWRTYPRFFFLPEKNREEALAMMGNNTKIYDKFEYWTVADCECSQCLYYISKKQPCPLEVCSIADIREEAARREQAVAERKDLLCQT